MLARDVETAVKAIRGLYESEFTYKSRGKFVLTRVQLAKVLGVKRLAEGAIIDLQLELLEEESLVLSYLDNESFAVIEVEVAARWRKVPDKVLDKVLHGVRPRVDEDKVAEQDEEEEE